MKMQNIRSKDLWHLVDGVFNLMHPELNRHHQMVSYLAYHMAAAADLPKQLQHLTLQAAYLHDIGGVIEGENISVTDIEAVGYHAAQISANLLEDFPNLVALGMIVRHCQTSFSELPASILSSLSPFSHSQEGISGLGEKRKKKPTACKDEKLDKTITTLKDKIIGGSPASAACLIHLADDVALQIDPNTPVLNQVKRIIELAEKRKGSEYSPQAVEALKKLERIEQIWLDMAYAPHRILDEVIEDQHVGMTQAYQVSKLIAIVIDFRSPFTAMHSAGVAASAKTLARLAGMDAQECEAIEIAGNLHDLGKIRTPQSILEKPGKLTDEEYNVIKEHAYFTDLLLGGVAGFEEVRDWAALHHEKMNGTGYPYHRAANAIPLGAKIMAVADVFSAITEERPYRKGMPEDKVKSILRENAERGELSPQLVEILIENYDEINAARDTASKEAGRRYYKSMKESQEES